ncbi:MAG: alkaline phosphatase family protein [Myxococcales bacterium]|nr:alkaline phosphatase family protein [Myxococcales bacterium]
MRFGSLVRLIYVRPARYRVWILILTIFFVLALIPFLRSIYHSPGSAYSDLDAAAVTLIKNPPAVDLLTGERLTSAKGARDVRNDQYKFRVEHPGYQTHYEWSDQPPLPADALLLAPDNPEAYRRLAWKNPAGPKLIVLQFDGMTPALVERYRAEHSMPALETMLERGTGGRLTSCCELRSPPIWTTINSGLPPAEHGIEGFLKSDPRTGDLLDYQPADVHAPRLWDITRRHGLWTALLGVFLIDPQENLLGPQKLASGRRLVAQWRAEKSPAVVVLYLTDADYTAHRHFLEAEPEHFRRQGWHFTDEAVAFYREALPQAYRTLDAWIGLALTLAGPDTAILLLSDHGLRPVAGPPLPIANAEKLAAILNKNLPGFTACDTRVDETLQLCARPGTDLRSAKELLENAKLDSGEPLFAGVSIHDLTAAGAGEPPARVLEAVVAPALLSPDRRPTDRWNIGNRHPHLSRLFDFDATNSGEHDPEGVYYLAGAGIRVGSPAKDPSVFDAMPTMLTLLGLPAALDMPGRAWTECLDGPKLLPRIASYGRSNSTAAAQIPSAATINHLKSLNYIQ